MDRSIGTLGNARPVAVVTAAVSRHLDQDIAPTLAALSDLGISTRVVEWDDPTVVWSDFALALVRSPWDYSTRLSEYLEWILNRRLLMRQQCFAGVQISTICLTSRGKEYQLSRAHFCIVETLWCSRVVESL